MSEPGMSIVANKILKKSNFKQDNYKLFTKTGWQKILDEKRLKRLKEIEKHKHFDEGKLVDGELKFDTDDFNEDCQPDPELIAGCVLPEEKLGTFPMEMLGKPLEEIDQNLTDKSFVVINTRFKVKYIYRYTATKSFLLCAPWNKIRKLALLISTNQIFDYLIMLTILINCVFLALNSDYPISEYVFLAIYTLEMVIRMVARGLIVNSYTYLRDPYNLVDILIIMLSYIMIIIEKCYGQNNVNVSSLRTLRVLRALKTITILPGLKTITSALIKSFKMLFEVIILSLFCMSFFALFALQIYQGTLRNKCVKSIDWVTVTSDNNTDINLFYYNWTHNASNWMKSGINYLTCGNDTSAGNCSKLNSNSICLPNVGPNPNFGYTNFDNFGWALLSMFQLITLDFWENQYNLVIRSSGSWNILFYIIVVFFGSFYLINLMLAVVSMSYEEEAEAQYKENEEQQIRKKKEAKNQIKLKRKSKANTGKLNKAVQSEVDSSYQMKMLKFAENDDNLRYMDSEEEKEYEDERNGDYEEEEEDEDDDDDDDEEGNIEEEIEETGNNTNNNDGDESNQILKENCDCCSGQNSICSKWMGFQNKLYVFVTDPFFDLFISFCIFINTIIMASEHYPSEKTWDDVLKYSNIIFTVIYIIECSLKIMSMSKEYFNVGWNIFDFVVVIASIIDLGVEEVDALSIFRAFRLFRVFKLAQSWQTMRLLLTIIFSTITEMGNLSIIVLLVLYMFAVIGKQSYRNTYQSNVFGDNIPRWNFDDFWHSMILVFRIICGEWIEPSFDCIRANGPLCLLIFIPTLVLGNFVVLNLFLALLLNSFASDSLKNTADEDMSKLKIVIDRLKSVYPLSKNRMFEKKDANQDFDSIETLKDIPADMLSENIFEPHHNHEMITNNKIIKDLSLYNEMNFLPLDKREDTVKFMTNNNNNNNTNNNNSNNNLIEDNSCCLQEVDNVETSVDENENTDESKPQELKDCCCSICFNPFQQKQPCHCCYCIVCDIESPCGNRWHKFRNKSLKITEHKAFEGTVLVCILASSICLCFEDIYLDNNPILKQALRVINYIFTSLFCIEMILKIISLGFKVYFTSFWTILDFFIVSISLLSLINDIFGFGTEMTAFRSLRTMRALRPLRAISRWQGMKIVVNALIYAIPSIFNVLLVCLVFWLIFSITGVQFFKGKFFKCLDSVTRERLSATIVPNKSECLRQNHTWVNSNINFDNATNGFLALYQIATFEGWMEIMQDAIDSTGINLQPKKENQMAFYVYFVIFILVGSFFILNLFIGVIIDNFNRLKNKYEGNYIDVFLTASQRNYYNTMKKLSNRKPRKTVRRPKAQVQGFFYDVAMSNRFELVIVVLIFLNMMVMMIEHYKQTATFTNVLDMINIMFSTIFTLEAMVKICGLRWHYFRYVWNIFDFIIVLLNIIDLVFNLFRSFSDSALFMDETLKASFITPTLLRVVRIFRIGRVLRLIKVAKGIRKLLFALFISLPALFNIGALLLLIVFIYAIVGMSVFGNLKKTGGLDDLVNFENFERSMLLLFRLTTAGGWNDVLEAMFIQPPYCNNTHVMRDGVPKLLSNGDCGTPWFGILYMTTFIFICYLIIINMYIAIILENFNQAHAQEEVGITEDDFEMFYLVWERYDPHASQYIKYANLSDFVAELDEPLGIPKPNMIALVSFDLPIVEGDKMHCLDILIALVKHVIGDIEDSEEFRKIKRQMELKYEEVFPNRVHTNVITTTMKRKKEDIAAKTLQRAWKHVKAQRAFKHMAENATLSSRHDSYYLLSNRQALPGSVQISESSASVSSFLKIPQFSRTN